MMLIDTAVQNEAFLKGVLGSGRHPELPEYNQLRRTCVFMLMKDTDEREIITILKSDNPGYAWRNQIALPGGHMDSGDKSPLAAALRELSEELGIRSENVNVAGSLGHFPTINNRDIEAFVGVWNGEDEICYDKREISDYFEIPLAHFVSNHLAEGYAGRLPSIAELKYPVESHVLWGATARIFHHFLELIISYSD